MTTTAETTARLTRAEAAYAHLAGFQAGDLVDLAGPRFYPPGVITVPQRIGEPSHALDDTYVIVDDDPAEFGVSRLDLRRVVRVKHLLSGQYTITLQAERATGNVRYFDPAGYAAQNQKG